MAAYIGEVRTFAGNFAPAGWAFCNGASVGISENDALFTLIGTTYGGDGQSTFNLPNLGGRVPVHQGTSKHTGTTYVIGQSGGVESVTLTGPQTPSHTHVPIAESSTSATTKTDPTNALYGSTSGDKVYSIHTGALKPMVVTSSAGGSQPHENRQPSLAITFIICLYGIYPTQS
ncbi:MAG TPA: tail fiber protein [Candidatus Baltobacteraceae bacterium]|nr:tail fiber protein [Candidatus Baltobacteraceae bacterium]